MTKNLGVAYLAALLVSSLCSPALAQSSARSSAAPRCIRLELYIDAEKDSDLAARDDLDELIAGQRGLSLRVYDLADEKARQRFEQLRAYFKRDDRTPLLYGCGKVVVTDPDPKNMATQLRQLTTMTVYVRAGCPHCADAKRYLPRVTARYPALNVTLRDIIADPAASRDLNTLASRRRIGAVSVPVFDVCSETLVGWDTDATSGARLERVLQKWSIECPKAPRADEERRADSIPNHIFRHNFGWLALGPWAALTMVQQENDEVTYVESLPDGYTPAVEDDEPALPLPGNDDELPLPGVDDALPLPGGADDAVEIPLDDDTTAQSIDLPWFGRMSVSEVGLPAFTIAVGLVDGFNPCAMWVLLFLLSVLINVRSRWKMLAVAGTFVFISGAVYFAFMVAWLTIFQFIGMISVVRITLAVLAILMGAIHVKDFFAFKKGVSLSIPESAKPGIYDRVRRIVTAENIAGAIIGASILAVLVNMIELLCTAGLPALYTGILNAQGYPPWMNYSYILLYNLAYMFDDALMVTIVVVTMDKKKMQEKHGRWLKLISGAAILLLGVIMLVRPQWLGMATS